MTNTDNVTELPTAKRETQFEQLVASFMQWAFSKEAVQQAVADQIKCSTPLGALMHETVNDSDREVSVDDIDGLERAIEDAVESALDHHDIEIDAGDVKDLDDAIEEKVEGMDLEVEADNVKGLEDAITSALGNALGIGQGAIHEMNLFENDEFVNKVSAAVIAKIAEKLS